MKKKELGIIDGQYLVRETSTGDYKDRMDIYTDYGFEIAEVMPYAGNQKANATLIADAFNTANKCGLLPSELLGQNQKLLSALKDLVVYCRGNMTNQLEPLISKANYTIDKIQNN